MSSKFEQAVDAFLNNLKTTRIPERILRRIWAAFQAYCSCLIAEAFRQKGFNVKAENAQKGFRFKCFAKGNAVVYSFFRVTRNNENYEIRLNIDAQHFRYNSIRLNLDIVIIKANSLRHNVVDSGNDLLSFMECKNMNGYPELVATLEGMVYNLQRRRLKANNNCWIPCCLLLSGRAGSLQKINQQYIKRGYSIRIYYDIQPHSTQTRNFVQNLI